MSCAFTDKSHSSRLVDEMSLLVNSVAYVRHLKGIEHHNTTKGVRLIKFSEAQGRKQWSNSWIKIKYVIAYLV